jgi:hypothetical protein
VIAGLAAGAGIGLGFALLVYGLRPPKPALAELLAALRRPPKPALTVRQRAYAALAAPLARLGLPRSRVREDLALLQKDPAQHLAEQAAATLSGALVTPVAASLLGFRFASAQRTPSAAPRTASHSGACPRPIRRRPRTRRRVPARRRRRGPGRR